MLAHMFGREEQQSLAVDSRVLEGLLQLCQANRAEPVPAATPQLSDPKQTNKHADQPANQRTNKQTNKQTPMARRARSQLPHPTSSVVHARTGLTRCEEGDSPASVRNLRPVPVGYCTLHAHTADAGMRTRTHTSAFSLPPQRVRSRFVAQRGTARHSAAQRSSTAQRSTAQHSAAQHSTVFEAEVG